MNSNKLKAIVTIGTLLSCSTLALAQQRASAKPSPWALSLEYGSFANNTYRTQIDVLKETGTPIASLVDFDNADTGFSLGVSYTFSNKVYAQLGYTDQGEIANTWGGDVRDVNAFVRAIQISLPVLGSGPYAKAGYHYDISDSFFARAYMGMFAYHQSVRSNVAVNGADTATTKQSVNGVAGYIGSSVGVRLNEQFNVTLSAERFDMDAQVINGFKLGLEYQF